MNILTLEYIIENGYPSFAVHYNGEPTFIKIIPEVIIDLHRVHNINTSKEIAKLMTNCFGSDVTDEEVDFFISGAINTLNRFIQNNEMKL